MCPTLNTGDNTGESRATIVFSHTAGIDHQASNTVTPTVLAGHDRMPADSGHAVVRRLTPLECERLQGFPDGHTDVPGASDSARYKQAGNAVTVNVFDWVFGRLVAVHEATR